MVDRYQPLRTELDARIDEARLYQGSDAFRAFVRLMQAIDACYSEDLRTENMDRAAKLRGGSAQLRALIDTLTDLSGSQTPKI